MNESQRYEDTEGMKTILKSYILSDSIYMTFWKSKNCSENRVVATRGRNGGECDHKGTTVMYPDCGGGFMNLYLR